MKQLNRRDFLRTTTVAGFGVWVTGTQLAWAESKSPNEKLNIGIIGCGGQGASDLRNVSSENIVALCDVDWARAANAFKEYPNARKYKDFRKMLEEGKDIDAVTISTPDHIHAPAALMAMKLGKHVYCQKPLTHTIYEARVLREAAAYYKVATQMGNQGHSNSGARRAVEVVRSGAIGAVREVHCWTDRPIWPQGLERPTETVPVPDTLDWDLWLGPAPVRPYNPCYVPFKWRGWWDFGCGALGDMACHVMDMAFWSLNLENPLSVEAQSSGVNDETAPKWSIITYEFGPRGDLPPCKLIWYDGGKKPPRELFELPEDAPIESNGTLMIGDKGKLYSPDAYGASFRLWPAKDFEGYQPPPET
ncbi:MAG: Gfo/Idh/MocA family oxidoreductase, partial [Armatimonadota bacterium]|nr:Gfo/Idh/MocA family oxidoreductase [Armatimonadota bacterium]